MFRRLCGLLACLPLIVAAAPPAAPPSVAPKSWDARIRYRISSFGNERILQYREMLRALDDAGFKRTDEPPETEADDPRATRLSGTLPERSVDRVLRQRHVRSVLLLPRGAELPEKGKRVRVEVHLGAGYPQATQRDLARQAVAVLGGKGVGFVEAVGYDHRGFSRLVGSVPAESVDKLFDDPMLLPGAEDQPLFRKIGALRLIIARPDLPIPSVHPPAPVIPAEQLKFDPALRALLGAEAAGQPGRLEVILGYTPKCDDTDWIGVVERSGAVVEGRTGPLVTVVGVVKEIAPKLAALEEVVAVRVPRVARIGGGQRAEVPDKWEPVRASGLAKLHALGQRGKGVRVAIVADDFKGWTTLKGRKDGKVLFPDPVLVDLTAARSADLRPDPYPSDAKGPPLGPGTLSARALLKAAPEAQLTLIRVDAAAPYMLEEAARAINGEAMDRTVTLRRRFRELDVTRSELDRRGAALAEERRAVFANLSDADEPKKRREAYFAKQEAFDKERGAFNAREDRYFKLIADLKKMRGIRIVASGLVWVDGFPVDGSSAFSRYFDDRPFKAALWFQAAGDVRGQAWAGLFRDADSNGVMEFADEKARLPRGAWTKEINFLSWQSFDAGSVRDAPQNARVRITLQWREPHDCLPLKVGEDLYREPLAKLRLVLVRQFDPTGKERPIDDVEVIAETGSLPQRLNQTLNAATWEHVIELRLPKPGRYGVFVEGKIPDSTQAKGEVRLPMQKRFGELRTRLFVNTLEGDGRATWVSYPTAMGSLGVPADSGRAVTVGAADDRDRARPTSAEGPPYNLSLVSKPDVLAYDEGGGTSEAAGFAAGLAATSVGARGSFVNLIDRMSRKPGEVLRVPPRK